MRHVVSSFENCEPSQEHMLRCAMLIAPPLSFNPEGVDSPRLAAPVVCLDEHEQEQAHPQEPQCLDPTVSPSLPGEIPKGGVQRRSRGGDPRRMHGDWQAVRNQVCRNRGRQRSRTFSHAVRSDVQPNQDRPDDQKHYGARSVPAGSEREEAVVGRRVLVRRILHEYSRTTWERGTDPAVRGTAGKSERVQETAPSTAQTILTSWHTGNGLALPDTPRLAAG